MVERIEEMPPGVIGLRSSGKLTADDYRDVMERPCRRRSRAARPASSS